MATPEQLTERLHERIKTEADLDWFVREWGGDTVAITGAGLDFDGIVSLNAKWFVAHAMRTGQLNRLGMLLGLPSDEHAAFVRNVWTDRRSWVAISISVAALILSAYAVFSSKP